MRCVAISDRTWLATTSLASCWLSAGAIVRGAIINASIAPIAIGTANRTARGTHASRRAG